MRPFLAAIFAFIGLTVNALTGVWSGNLEVQGTKLPLVFHFDEGSPTMDSPAQNAKGIPIKVSHDADGNVAVTIPLVGASFSGKLENGCITGTFRQNGLSLPLTLTSGEEKPKRPQTPQPPFPYSEEEVSFSNGDATLSGTLTLPPGYGKDTPVVLMVTGSGLQNRDEEIFDHKPFAVIADALARSGIASLRYDDRGFGASTGDPVNCTTEDLMRDALAGVDLLRGRFNKVGVLGHSEGGTIALMLAADGKTDFVVSLAGMVVSGKETLLDQNRLALTEAGLPATTVDTYCDLLSKIFDNEADLETLIDNSDLLPALKQNLHAVVGQMQSPYMRYFVSLDLRDRLANITCPVLAVNGTRDTQVFSTPNLDALQQGLPANPRNSILPFDGLNHLFQHCNTGATVEYATIEETLSPDILADIISWLNSLE